MKLLFNHPPYTGKEEQYVLAAMKSAEISGNGPFTRKCQQWFQEHLSCRLTLLTPSCTHALEMAAILIDTQPGDEIIMPSYTFVSTANAFALRGAKIVFVDIRPDTMNIDENLIEVAITERTKAIVPVHYAGVSCEMDSILSVANRHNLYVIEDAAQGMMARYDEKPLGSFGHLAAYSFHETKNYTSAGEGGLLIINDERFCERAEIIREKGTNRSQYFRGSVDKYSWVDIGSSYLPSDLQAAYLWGQLEMKDRINETRLEAWNHYSSGLSSLVHMGIIEVPTIPDRCTHNGHMFYIKVSDMVERTSLLEHFHQNEILAVFHYVPLHSSPAGKKYGIFNGQDRYTTSCSEQLLRLPLWFGIDKKSQNTVIQTLQEFYG